MTLEELERRNYSQATVQTYIDAIRRFAEHFHRSPDHLGPLEIREYQLHLYQRKLHPQTIRVHTAALRFFYRKVLHQRLSADDLPLPKLLRRQIPIVLSPDEVTRMIHATTNLRHRTILMTLYSTGMRRSELCHLRPEDIDKERMVVRIRQGKGGKDREVPLSPKLLEQLRTCYRSVKVRNGWMFPSLQTRRADQPITQKAVWHACREATRRAGITKAVHPHTLRHYAASRTMPHRSAEALSEARRTGVFVRFERVHARHSPFARGEPQTIASQLAASWWRGPARSSPTR
jgi:site-specific recombinase XerD